MVHELFGHRDCQPCHLPGCSFIDENLQFHHERSRHHHFIASGEKFQWEDATRSENPEEKKNYFWVNTFGFMSGSLFDEESLRDFPFKFSAKTVFTFSCSCPVILCSVSNPTSNGKNREICSKWIFRTEIFQANFFLLWLTLDEWKIPLRSSDMCDANERLIG